MSKNCIDFLNSAKQWPAQIARIVEPLLGTVCGAVNHNFAVNHGVFVDETVFIGRLLGFAGVRFVRRYRAGSRYI